MNSFLLVFFTGAVLWGTLAGALGVFLVLRRQSLLADALSHAALPGIVGAFLLTGSVHPFVLFCGACCAGCIALGCMLAVKKTTHLGYDALLGIVIAVFFGSGIALLTACQRYGGHSYAVLSKFLLGNLVLISYQDCCVLFFLLVLVCVIYRVLWKDMVLITFDPAYAHSCGYLVTAFDMLFSCLLVAVVCAGMQIGGAVVTSSLLVTPAIIAQYFSYRIRNVVFIASASGALITFCGALCSYYATKIPAGPAAVCCGVIFLLCSMAFRWGYR